MTGASVSVMFTVKLQVTWLPEVSLTTKVFVVTAVANTVPLACPAVRLSVPMLQLSWTVGRA